MALIKIFKTLDNELAYENREFARGGMPVTKRCEFKLLGQFALIEAQLNLILNSTNDVDAYTNAQAYAIEKLTRLLSKEGLSYDQLSAEIWMPKETQYTLLYDGEVVRLFRAEPEYVLASKAKFAPRKNRDLILAYLSKTPKKLFFDLCETYGVDLARIVDDVAENHA